MMSGSMPISRKCSWRACAPGNRVKVHVDVYGGDVMFHGHLVGIGAGSGSAFALLPAQNASGNWIKIVQRVPVRILLDPQELKAHPLRIGLSAHVSVDLRDSQAVAATARCATRRSRLRPAPATIRRSKRRSRASSPRTPAPGRSPRGQRQGARPNAGRSGRAGCATAA